MTDSAPKTRIQQRNTKAILDAALAVFSQAGYRGATLDQIASEAGLSKPNLLYYFKSKEAIHAALIEVLMGTWLEPLRAVDPGGDAVDEIVGYVLRKLDMTRTLPRESRLFANEILQGAPRSGALISGPLKALVDEKAAVIAKWVSDGRIAPIDGHHLIFSIWATTQHYADFDVQVRGILGAGVEDGQVFADARDHLDKVFRRALTPG